MSFQQYYFKRFVVPVLRLSILCSLLTGCYKDKGNYAYHVTNEVVISTISDTFRVNKFDTLSIVPAITQTQSLDTGRLKYEWSVYLTQTVDLTEPAFNATQVVSKRPNLNLVVGLNAEAGFYNLNLKVTDTVTKVSFYKNLYLYVSNVLQTGWMALEQKSDHCDISMIAPSNKVYYNVYSTTNPGAPLDLTTKQVVSLTVSAGTLGVVNFVLGDRGGYYLDKKTMKVSSTYANFFYGAPSTVQPQNMVEPSTYLGFIYTFNAGTAYFMNPISSMNKFGAALSAPDTRGAVLAPFAAGSRTYNGVFFDQANYRFLYDRGTTSLNAFPPDNTTAFDLNNVQKKMICMKGGLVANDPANFYCIFQNLNDDSCFLYSLDAKSTPLPQWQQPILNSPGVANSVGYLFSTSLMQMYYTAGNMLYVYDITANQSRVVYQCAAGENITAISLRNNVVVMATYNGQPGGGSVYYLPLSTTGDVQGGTYSNLFTGFDKIISLAFKLG